MKWKINILQDSFIMEREIIYNSKSVHFEIFIFDTRIMRISIIAFDNQQDIYIEYGTDRGLQPNLLGDQPVAPTLCRGTYIFNYRYIVGTDLCVHTEPNFDIPFLSLKIQTD